MAIAESTIKAKVFHSRLTPKKNTFKYKQYYVLLKARKNWVSRVKLLSINAFNLFSFIFKKYGNLDATDNPYDYAYALLEKSCEDISWLEDIYVLTQPALLGWAFNPVTFWFYLDKDRKLRAVLSEVNNTFGEHHKYFAHHDDFSQITVEQTLSAEKVFYVSPFCKVEGEYKFRFDVQDNKIGVWIDYYVEGKKILLTSLVGPRKPLSSFGLLKLFFKIPLANLKTVFLIHWQALKIWVKKIKYIPRNKHKTRDVSRCQ